MSSNEIRSSVTGESGEQYYASVDSGISEDDRKDVLERIDRIALENRIEYSDSLFRLDNVRSGRLFPILVTVLSIVVLTLMVIILGSIFRSDSRSMATESVEYSSIEGQLIRELRRESQQQISQKDREIQEIEGRISQLENERALLIDSIEERVQARLDDYNQIIAREVDEEKIRLEGEGISSSEIQRLLTLYEAELRAYYDGELQKYREELEREKIVLEQNIEDLRSEYDQRLAELRSERAALLADFQSQEAALRNQLLERTRVLEESRTAAVEDLEAARQQLADLEIQKEQASLVENQIIGYYRRIEGAIERSAYDEALTIITQTVSYLNEGSVIAAGVLDERRPVDLFLLNQLKRSIENQQLTGQNYGNVRRQLELLGKISLNDRDAAEAIARGDSELAARLYEASVNLIPELKTAHSALVEQAIADYDEQLAAELELRAAEASGLLQQAATAVSAGDYEGALFLYDEVLSSVPELVGNAADINSNLIRMGYSIADRVIINGNAGAFAPILQRARVESANTLNEVSRQISTAVLARENELFAQMAEADQEASVILATYEQRLSEQEASYESELDTAIGTRDTTIASQAQELEELSTRAADLQSERDSLYAEVERLAEFEELLNSVTAQYDSYLVESGTISGSSNESELVQALRLRNALEQFLGSRELDSVFPGLADEYRGSDEGLQAAGREDGLQTALEILQGIFGQASDAQQLRYLENELNAAQADGNAALENFLVELQAILYPAQ